MRRFCLLLLAVLGWTAVAGCQSQSGTEPLTPEQQRELQKQMQQVQDEERARAAQE